jgi:predicted ABC-type ATPase
MELEQAIRSVLLSFDNERPFLICIAGPNGAGKSTLYPKYIQPILDDSGIDYEYLNADEISLMIREEDTEVRQEESDKIAQKIISERRQQIISQERSLIYETVFSHASKVEEMRRAMTQSYIVVLVFVGLRSIDISKDRVARRVKEGGHAVPDDKLEGRFMRTIQNMRDASAFVSMLLLVDNSSENEPFEVVILCGKEIETTIVGRPNEYWISACPALFS